jgi:hypothetical protein
MEKKKSSDEMFEEFKADFAKLNLAKQAFMRATVTGDGIDEALTELVAVHGEVTSTVTFNMDDWDDGSNDFWTQGVPDCTDDHCPCKDAD